MLPAILTSVLFALSAVSAHRSARMLGATRANFWRLLVATALLALGAHTLGTGLEGQALPWLLLSGAVGFGLGDLALFQALPRLGSRLTILLVQCLATPVGAGAEWIWLGTPLSGPQIFWGLTILAGVALALGPGEHPHLTRRTWMVGTAYGLLAAVGQGGGAVLSRRAFAVGAASGENIDGVTAAYQRILGGLGIAALGWWLTRLQEKRRNISEAGRSNLQQRPIPRSASAGWWVLVNALCGPALGVSCFQWALKSTPTGIVLPIVATTPLMVIPLARLMEGERVTGRAVAGGAMAVAGAIGLSLVT